MVWLVKVEMSTLKYLTKSRGTPLSIIGVEASGWDGGDVGESEEADLAIPLVIDFSLFCGILLACSG